MATLGINRTVDGILTSADSATLTILNSAGVVVVIDTPVVASSAGVYSYDVSALSAGDYTAQWTFVVSGFADDVVVRIFTVDSPIAVVRGITLSELERRLARRIGPFHHLRTAAAGSSLSGVTIQKLRSNLAIGDYEEMFMLRRGMLSSGRLVENFIAEDRQRIVDAYTPSTGILAPDFVWEKVPVTNEMIELHALDPEEELRYALQDGLRRCYFWDVIITATTGYLRELDVTAIAPWITRSAQIRRIQYSRAGYVPYSAPWFDTYQSGGSVMLQTEVPNVGSLRIHVLRPHSSFVNGETSGAGPDSDNDVLYIDPEYAIRAGHLHAWINFPSRLADLVVAHRQMDFKDVAAAFTLKSRTLIGSAPEFIQNRFQQDDLWDNLQIGNA